MKLIIIEGTDNTGKDTVISNLLKQYNKVKIIHCDKPIGNTPDEYAQYQDNAFRELAIDNLKDNMYCDLDVIIHNRSWYGEYVYGCMYRNNQPERVFKTINNCENLILQGFSQNDIIYITLLSDNVDFLIKNDDGLSISNAKKDKIIEETKRFEIVHKHSIFKNKKIIYVNNGTEFRSREDIMNEINNLINNG